MAVSGVAGGVGTATGGLGGIEHLSVTLRQLPTDTRENAELILADENYRATLQSVDGLTGSITGVSQAVESLPAEIRGTLGTLEETQPELQNTIKGVETLLAQAERASQAIESTIRAAGETAEIAARLMPEPKPEPVEPPEPSEPFRMESVTEAAEALGVTIGELRATILSLHDLINEPQIPVLASTAAAESKAVVDHGAMVSRNLVDYVIIRLLMLLAGCLVLLLIYHVARHFIMLTLTGKKTGDAAPVSH